MNLEVEYSLQGWLQRLGIQIEGGQGFLLDKLISITGKLGMPVCFSYHSVFCCVLYFLLCVEV